MTINDTDSIPPPDPPIAEPPKGRRDGYSAASYNSYYNIRSAQLVKCVLDRMMQTNERGDIVYNVDKQQRFFYADFKLSRNTLMLLINGAWLWLVDNADPDKRYAKLKAYTRVHKESTGLTIRWRPIAYVEASTDIMAREEESAGLKTKRDNSWKPEFEQYIETAEDEQVFFKTGLNLDEHDLLYIADCLQGVTGFHFLAPPTKQAIKIIRRYGTVIEQVDPHEQVGPS